MNRGFSLVELSIVLVILGLLTGGILAGQSLIRAAELRSLSSEYQRYTAAINTFRDKYFALPGDMRNATAFWGDDNATCPDAAVPNGTPGTCNGNGSGILDYPSGASSSGEIFRGWQHLALAGLIEGSYSGFSGSTGNADYDFGSNSPQSRISSVGWGLGYLDNTAGGYTNFYNLNYREWMTVGGSDNAHADFPFLKPEEAWNIDTKMDDGMPVQGNIHSWANSGLGNCSSGPPSSRSATYNLSITAASCPLIIKAW